MAEFQQRITWALSGAEDQALIRALEFYLRQYNDPEARALLVARVGPLPATVVTQAVAAPPPADLAAITDVALGIAPVPAAPSAPRRKPSARQIAEAKKMGTWTGQGELATPETE